MSRFYVHVSRRYIRTGLDSMDRLSRIDIDEFNTKQLQLQEWCDNATDEIEALAREVCVPSMFGYKELSLTSQQGVEKVPLDIENSLKESLDTAMRRYQFWAGE